MKIKVSAKINSSGTFILGFSNTVPTINIVSPKDGVIINYTTPTVQVSIGSLFGIVPSTLSLKIDDIEILNPDNLYTYYNSQNQTIKYTVRQELTEGEHTIKVSVKDGSGNYASAISRFKIDKSVDYANLSLNKGWQLISFPILPKGKTTPEFLGISSPKLYRYQSGSYKKYGEEGFEDISAGKAYIIPNTNFIRFDLTGESIKETSYSISLKKGWNMFSNPYIDPVEFSDKNITVSDDGINFVPLSKGIENKWIKPYIYGYTGDKYTTLFFGTNELLLPGRGYWILVVKDIEMKITK